MEAEPSQGASLSSECRNHGGEQRTGSTGASEPERTAARARGGRGASTWGRGRTGDERRADGERAAVARG